MARKSAKKFQQGGITDWEAGKPTKLGKVIVGDLPKNAKGPRLKPRTKSPLIASK